MKVIHIITHPVTLIVSFLFILISGEHWGGFYILYLLLALPHGGMHALLGLVGTILLCVAIYQRNKINKHRDSSLLCIGGALLMAGSLLSFFMQRGGEYNYGTFTQTVPVISLIVFVALVTSFLTYNIFVLKNSKGQSTR